MSKHVLKLHIETPGTLYSLKSGETTRSLAGHAWFEMISPEGKSMQAGFAQKNPKSEMSSVPGKVYDNDGDNYKGLPAFTASYEMTEDQARTLERFIQSPKQFGFDLDNYHAITNSCVDFVWKALEAIGMNPTKKEGDILPLDNMDDFMFLVNMKMLKFPDPFTSNPWDTRWLKPGQAISIELNKWTREPEGTVTVGPLGNTMPPPLEPPTPAFRPVSVIDARFSADMGSGIMGPRNFGPSFPSFVPPPPFIGRMPSFSCGRDYVPYWGH